MFQKEKGSLVQAAKAATDLNLNSIATTLENQVKVVEGPPVKEFQIEKECVIQNMCNNTQILVWNNEIQCTDSSQHFL